MKNQREIYQALLDGETLINAKFTKVILDNGQLRAVHKVGFAEEMPNFLYPQIWQIYKEPKGYENIPDGGVLCWCYDEPETYVRIITEYCDDKITHKFKTNYGGFVGDATPLTKQEIQVFVNNAPEDI